MSRKKDFLWRYQPSLNSDKAKMLSYIQNQSLHPFQDKTVMIITALNAYYMALALYNEGSHSHETLELIFLDSVKAIAHHLQYVSIAIKVDLCSVTNVLCTVFGGLETRNTQLKKSLNSSIELPTSNIDEEFDDSNLKVWNLAGITTDSETFD
ncbi:hypothetical protein [Rivularia sp. UHCC 0363]|uniref:hypothetical protein n=1 Tax=Rivularia sp. UHCC 0363 TaxID=3110244 RepID=UPI002B1F720F|nr:hypothetical protein [Rivularia sp. UHCC 0363]MEA5599429.1 hypothetical protein [Rivularia sp. UHCC 0363]